MTVDIDPSWKPYLEKEFNESYFENLVNFVKAEYQNYQCFPKGKDIFKAFNYAKFHENRVVIIGQDPYHGPGQANGLCFSVNQGIPHPPSLVNIFKEIQEDLGLNYPSNGDLSLWAQQGVLLLNATLTVRSGVAGSHQNKGWERFTDGVIKELSHKKEKLVFLLWGGYAKKKIKLIDTNKHHILTSGHPSPLSANRGYWFGNKHFSKTNSLLERDGHQPIDWSLD
jgi:uracil-DNA glycosylase